MALWKEQAGKESVPAMTDPGLNGLESMTYTPERPLAARHRSSRRVVPPSAAPPRSR